MTASISEDLQFAIEAFHFLRPFWLLLLLPLSVIWWLNQPVTSREEAPPDRIAPHLSKALTIGDANRSRIKPIDHVALVLFFTIIGAAGPSWTRQVDPFLAQNGPLVIALEVTPSMESDDLPPERLERAKQKIRDLLNLRAGARTALVAYAGSAHRVLPLTEDSAIAVPYLEGLAPQIMPKPGNDATAALELADHILSEEIGGSVLFVLDGLDAVDVASLEGTRSAGVVVLVMLPDGIEDRGLDLLNSVPVVRASPDDGDVERLDRLLNRDYRRALLENSEQPWEDRGWLFAIPAALLALLWFRRGWTMSWSVSALVICASLFVPSGAKADGIKDWFLTPDQQGYLAFQQNKFSQAADSFIDPLWKGYALYRSGQYADAADVLGRLQSPEASFTQGLAHIKNRQYREGLRAFETTLQRDPDFPGAAENLETTKQIIDFVEAAREASDTGEDSGIGADDVVFDNEAKRGSETQSENESVAETQMLTTEQWMNTVDTKTSDFLRMRFQFEALSNR